MKKLLSNLAVGFAILTTCAQAQVLDFEIPLDACRQEKINVVNTSNGITTDFFWDFCEGELNSSLAETTSIKINSIDQAAGIRTVRDGLNYYSLVIDRGTNTLKLIDFGTDLANQPSATTVPMPENVSLVSPQGLVVISINNAWHVFVVSTGNNKIYRLDFGSFLTNSPIATELNFSGNLVTPIEIEVANDVSGYFLAVVNFSGNNLVVANLGTSITNQPLGVNLITLTGAANPYGFSLRKFSDGLWRGVIGSFSNGKIHTVMFVDGLSQPPAVADITPQFTSVTNPVKLSLETWGNHSVLFVMSAAGFITRIAFLGGHFLDEVETSEILNATSLGAPLSFSLFYDVGKWKAMTFSNSTHDLLQLPFMNSCSSHVTSDYFQGDSPPAIEYSIAGKKNISLLTIKDGFTERVTKEITIDDLAAPQIDFEGFGVCENVPVVFNSSSTITLNSYAWDLGDNTTSTDQIPDRSYLAGEYNIRLTGIAENGCSNFVKKQIKIFPKPVASFILPSGLICTNKLIEVQNGSVDNFQGFLEYEWSVDEVPAGNERNLNYAFENTGLHAIRMVAKIPGCSSDLMQMTSPVQAGPPIDFSSTGVCEHDLIKFTSIVKDVVDSYSWNFDDGNTSIEVHPSHIFSGKGNYEVSLTALSPNGCENTKTKTITINEKPQPDFLIESPPSSCSGYTSVFVNLTPELIDSPVVLWEWNFNDGEGSSAKDPVHVFPTDGTFNVGLVATTDAGCSNMVQKPIIILPSPIATILNTATCKDKSTTFSAEGNDIKQYYWEMGTSYYEVPNPGHIFTSSGEHDVKLVLTGTNNCVTIYNEKILVPEVLIPNFSFTKNCAGFETQFTDLTSGSDPVASYLWNFHSEGTSTDEGSTSFTFTTSGDKPVKLDVLTQSGCSYTTTKTVNIVPAPTASFSMSTSSGAVPLEVEFSNESINANDFTWNFGNSETSFENSPMYTYSALGDFEIKLTAKNPQGCENTTTQNISVQSPLPDVELKLISVSKNPNGTLKIIITVENNGNTVIRNLPVEIDIAGKVSLTEIIDEAIQPDIMYNLILDYGVNLDNSINFICAETTLENDLNASDNRICKDLEQGLVIRDPFPNPTTDQLNLEWISPNTEPIVVRMTDMHGNTVFESQTESIIGLNTRTLYTHKFQAGLYILSISAGNTRKIQRIFVSGQN